MSPVRAKACRPPALRSLRAPRAVGRSARRKGSTMSAVAHAPIVRLPPQDDQRHRPAGAVHETTTMGSRQTESAAAASFATRSTKRHNRDGRESSRRRRVLDPHRPGARHRDQNREPCSPHARTPARPHARTWSGAELRIARSSPNTACARPTLAVPQRTETRKRAKCESIPPADLSPGTHYRLEPTPDAVQFGGKVSYGGPVTLTTYVNWLFDDPLLCGS